jgi:hypothetical protein
MRHRCRRLGAFVVAAAAACLVARTAVAATVAFTIDPAASTFTVGGTFNGAPLVAQAPGTAVVGFTGTLNVDVNHANGTLSFERATVAALDQPVDQQPTHPSHAGANYGLATAGGQTLFAIRGLDLNLVATGAPFNAGPPSAAQHGFFVNGGSLYYGPSSPATGFADLHGTGGGPAAVVGPITLTQQGDLETLTIPIQSLLTPGSNAPDVVELTFAGQLVATRPVPEPAACAALGAAALAPCAWRRPRRR